jgi:hypothetical protein
MPAVIGPARTRASLLLVLLLALLAPPAAAKNSFCFPRAYGPENNPICLAWELVGADFVFKIICTPDSFPSLSLSWCAVGFSTRFAPGSPTPPLGSWGMAPSDVVHLALVQPAPGSGSAAPGVVLTDRIITAVSLPPCAPTQVTRLLNATVDANTGELTAFFARPAKLPQSIIAQGYTNLNRTLPLVAAISNGGPLAAGGCGATFAPHDNEWRNETINFAKLLMTGGG